MKILTLLIVIHDLKGLQKHFKMPYEKSIVGSRPQKKERLDRKVFKMQPVLTEYSQKNK